jgi:hypothetical protein
MPEFRPRSRGRIIARASETVGLLFLRTSRMSIQRTVALAEILFFFSDYRGLICDAHSYNIS